jgi:hypothetical protein
MNCEKCTVARQIPNRPYEIYLLIDRFRNQYFHAGYKMMTKGCVWIADV